MNDQRRIIMVFHRMGLVYGDHFMRMWNGIPIDHVKQEWHERTAHFSNASIRYAFEHLPPMPPNLIQFVNLCKQAPAPAEPRQLRAPVKQQSPQAIAARQKAQQLLLELRGRTGNLDWATRVLAKAESGEKVAPWTVIAAQKALEKG